MLKCNAALHELLSKVDNVTLARHSNLRNEKWSFHKRNDDKHFSRVSISLFAANIKAAFRKSLGIPSKKYEHMDRTSLSKSRYQKIDRKKTHDDNARGGDIQSFKRELIQFLTAYKV